MSDHAQTTFVGEAAGLARLPAAVIEVESEFVLGARFGSSAKAAIRRLTVTGLDRGAIEPSAAELNARKPETLLRAIETVSKSICNGGGRTALLVPDATVRVCLLDFETLPSKTKELEALLGWRIKDSLGFPAEDAQLSYQENHRASGLIEFLVVAAKRDVLAQYEAAIERVRGGLVSVLPATLALLPLLSEAEAGCQLLTHVCSGSVTHALVEGKRLRFWRSRQLARADGDPGTAEVVSEASRAVASVRDRLNLEITRAWCCSRPAGAGEMKAALEAALGVPVEPLPLRVGLEAGLRPEERPLFNLFGAPLAGMISNSGRSS